MIVRLAIVLALLGLAGCSCEDDAPVLRGDAPAALESTGLPRATRDDLPAATPALVVRVERDAFAIDNAELIASWPAADRERVADAHVEGRFDAPAESELLVAGLHGALQRAAEVERMRALPHGGGAPIAYALRVAADAPWSRVQQAIYTAGQAGWAEPRFVLRAPSGERDVQLAIPLPTARTEPRLDPEIARALEEQLRELSGAEPDVEIPAPVFVPSPKRTLRVAIASDGRITAQLDERTLCTLDPHDGAPDLLALGRCLEGDLPSSAELLVARDVTFGAVAPVLETLRARGDVSIVVAP